MTEWATSSFLEGELAIEARVVDLPWSQLPGPPGGPVMDVAVSPVDDDYVYATTVTAGLFASDDGGESWIQGPEASHHYREVEASPHDPAVARTAGGTRTTVAGRQWYSGFSDHEQRRFPRDLGNFGDLAFDPIDEQIVYGGAHDGFYRTDDGGLHWERAGIPVATRDDNVSRIAVASQADGVVYAGFYRDATVLRSEDFGRTWQVVVGPGDFPPGPLRGLVTDRTGERVYIWADNRGLLEVGTGDPTVLGPDIPSPHLLFYDGLTISADDERLYFNAFSTERMDEGDLWSDLALYEFHTVTGETRTIDVPEKQASVTAHPTDAETLFLGGWSWVWESPDRGGTWTARSNTFVDRYLATVGTNPDRPGTVVPGSICSGGVWTSHDQGETYDWKRSGLDPFHPSGPRHYEEHYAMRAAGGGNRFYVTTAAGLLVSEDNGDTWTLVTDVPGYDTHGLDHYHGLGVDPSDPMRVFVGTGLGRQGRTNRNRRKEPGTDRPSRIWRTPDGGESWTEVTDGFPADRRTVVQDVLVDRTDGDVVYVGTNAEDYIAVGRGEDAGTGFGVFRSSNGGGTWTQLSAPFENVHSLTQDAADPSILYASTPAGVYRSGDGGAAWTKILPHRTKALLAHPAKAGVVFAGAKKYENYWDLLVSDDGGETWAEGNLTIQIGNEPSGRDYDGVDHNADYRGDKGQLMDLAFDPGASHLVAATRGASLWRADVEGFPP